MIAVAQHHCRDVVLPAGVDKGRVVVGILAVAPAVECFVDHEEAYAVAGVEECLGRQVVRCAHGVEPGFFHKRGFAYLGAVVSGGSEDAVVVVEATAVEYYGAAVERESVSAVLADAAESCRGSAPVYGLSVGKQFGGQRVQGRGVGAPQAW